MSEEAPVLDSNSDEIDAAVKIQAVSRGKKDREAVQEKKDQKDAAVKIQAISRGKNDRAMVQEKKEQTGAAVKIQAVSRGKKDREAVEEKKEQTGAAVKIQAISRGKKDREVVQEKRDQKDATIKIQAVAKGKKTREDMDAKRKKEAELAKIDMKLANQAKAKSEQLVDKLQDIEDSVLRLEMYHTNKDGGATFLGQTGVNQNILTDLPGCALRMDMPLRPKPTSDQEASSSGQCIFRVHRQHQMKVTLLSAKGLKKADTFGKSDPYAVFHWTGAKNSREKQLRKSITKPKTLEPNWEADNESVEVNLPVNLNHGCIRIELWDQDTMTSDEFLGHACMKGEKLAELVQELVGDESDGQVEREFELKTMLHPKKSFNKYVGGTVKLRLESHKLLKVAVVEASGLPEPEGSEVGCNPYCEVKWSNQLIGSTPKLANATAPVWTENTQSLKWKKDVMDAVPVDADGAMSSSKNAEAVKKVLSNEGSGTHLGLEPAVYGVLARFGGYLESSGYKKEQLFQAMDCEQNGWVSQADLVSHFETEASFKMSPEEATALMGHLDEDGNGVIDLHELEMLMNVSAVVAAHARNNPAASAGGAGMTVSASAPAIVQASPRVKLDEAIELDSKLNA